MNTQVVDSMAGHQQRTWVRGGGVVSVHGGGVVGGGGGGEELRSGWGLLTGPRGSQTQKEHPLVNMPCSSRDPAVRALICLNYRE